MSVLPENQVSCPYTSPLSQITQSHSSYCPQPYNRRPTAAGSPPIHASCASHRPESCHAGIPAPTCCCFTALNSGRHPEHKHGAPPPEDQEGCTQNFTLSDPTDPILRVIANAGTGQQLQPPYSLSTPSVDPQTLPPVSFPSISQH